MTALSQHFVKILEFPHFNRQQIRVVYTLEDQNGFLWFAGNQGYYRYDGKDYDFISFSTAPDNFTNILVGGLYEFENGNFWFAAGYEGLVIYDKVKQSFRKIQQFNFNDTIYRLDLINVHINETAQRYFLATAKGVWEVSIDGKPLQYFLPTAHFGQFHANRFSGDEVRMLYLDTQKNSLWMGGKGGLMSFDFKKNKFYRYPSMFKEDDFRKKKDDHFLVNDLIKKENKIITATWFGGIQTYDIEKQTWEKAALQHKNKSKKGIERLIPYGQNHWMVTHGTASIGIWKEGNSLIDTLKVEDKPFEAANTIFKDKNGYYWATHWLKIGKYKDLDQPPTPQTAQIYIRSVTFDSIPQNTILNNWNSKQIVVPNNIQCVGFQFRLINPFTYHGVKYEYRLGNKYASWKKNGSNEWVELIDLQSGDYSFEVRYWDSFSEKYIYAAPLKFTVEGTPKLVVYLVSALIGLIILSVLGFGIYRKRTIRKQKIAIERYEAQLREVQDAALRSQMNPHFLFNSLNSIRYFIVTQDIKNATNYLTKFSRLIRLILENSKKQQVTLKEELELITLYVKMEQIRFMDKFDFHLSINDNIQPTSVQLPPMLIQPFIENAILHGINPKPTNGLIELIIEKSRTHLTIKIKDNGIGRVASQEQKAQSFFEKKIKKKSLGMNITQTRLKLIPNKRGASRLEIIDLYDHQKKPIGTEVIMQIPLE